MCEREPARIHMYPHHVEDVGRRYAWVHVYLVCVGACVFGMRGCMCIWYAWVYVYLGMHVCIIVHYVWIFVCVCVSQCQYMRVECNCFSCYYIVSVIDLRGV